MLRYQDELEESIFGVAISKKHFDLQLRQTQLTNQLAVRVQKDQTQIDYTGQSLALRNNPWFFSKNYTIEPLIDDTDFYLIIETNVGQSNLVKKRLGNQNAIFQHQKEIFENQSKDQYFEAQYVNQSIRYNQPRTYATHKESTNNSTKYYQKSYNT